MFYKFKVPTFIRHIQTSQKMETSSRKIIAFTDSVNECECCGKKGLKGTFCVEIDGSEFYYGSTCAFKKHGFEKNEDFKKALSDFQKLQRCKRRGFESLEAEKAYDDELALKIQNWANQN